MGPQHASKPNELTFYRGAKTMTLFVNPCQCPTYVDRPLREGPSREKPYFQTNLTLGEIGNMGKIALAPDGAAREARIPGLVPWAIRAFSDSA